MRPLVLENGASGPPKTCVLQGFHVKLLFWLEVSGANAVPVLGGDRFFDAILPIRLRVDFWTDRRFFVEKGIEKGTEEASKLESLIVLGYDWGDEARGQYIYIYIHTCVYP